MKYLKAGGQAVKIALETEVTLMDVLERLGEPYIEDAIYRTAGGPLGPDDMVGDSDLIIVARAESNG